MISLDDALLEPVVNRIRRRLAIQHSRWLLSQSQLPVCFPLRRRLCRQWRRGWIWGQRRWSSIESFVGIPLLAVGGLLAIGFLIAAIGCLLVMPSVILLAAPGKTAHDGVDQRVAVAMLRMTLLPTALIAVYWLRCPGADRAVLMRSSASPNKPKSFIRAIRYRRPWLLADALLIAAVTMLGLFGLVGVVSQLPLAVVAVPLASISISSLAGLVWRVGLRLKRYQARLIGPLTVCEYLSIVTAVLGLAAAFTFFAPVETVWSQYLVWLGPLGFLWAQIIAVGTGDLAAMLGVLCFVTCCAAVGWLVAKDAGTWRNRRAMIESQRRALVTPIVGIAVAPALSKVDFCRKIRRDLDRNLAGRRFRSWRFWLSPTWLRRRYGWYVTIGITILVFQLVLIPLYAIVSHAEPVTVVGAAPPVPPRLMLSSLMAISITVMLFTVEAMSLDDRFHGCNKSFYERPVSPWKCWIREQCEGLWRMPIQLLLLLPFLLVGAAAGVNLNVGWDVLLCAIALLLLMRTLFAAFVVFNAYSAVTPQWALIPLKGIIFVAAYATLFMPMALAVLLQQSFRPNGIGVGLALANIGALILFWFISRFGDPPQLVSVQQ